MRAVQLFWHWLRLTGTGAAVAYVATSLLLAIAVSVAVYEWFERPIGASLRACLTERRARQAPLPRGAT
jgi:peptidoglycan/LPS O-acetylase OafA/YrhL